MAISTPTSEETAQEGSPRLTVQTSERMVIVGKTGSGKTYFAQRALASETRLVVCDAKGRIDMQAWGLTDYASGRADLLAGKYARLRIPPPLSDDEWDKLFWELYQYHDCTIYIDELSSAGTAQSKPGFRALCTRGRELKIRVVSSTQRPVFVPVTAISEAEWVVMFRLKWPSDIERMVKILGPPAARPIVKYHYLLSYEDWDNVLYCKPLKFEEVINR